MQPPSGGCVLKLYLLIYLNQPPLAATFGWLCVETEILKMQGVEIEGSHLRVAVC